MQLLWRKKRDMVWYDIGLNNIIHSAIEKWDWETRTLLFMHHLADIAYHKISVSFSLVHFSMRYVFILHLQIECNVYAKQWDYFVISWYIRQFLNTQTHSTLMTKMIPRCRKIINRQFLCPLMKMMLVKIQNSIKQIGTWVKIFFIINYWMLHCLTDSFFMHHRR